MVTLKSLTRRVPSFRTKPTVYLSLFLLLAYLRLLIYYCLEYYDLNLTIQINKELIRISNEQGLNISTSQLCQSCAPFWLGKYLTRGVVTLVGTLSSVLCLGFKSSVGNWGFWLSSTIPGLMMGQIYPAWIWIEKDLGKDVEGHRLEYEVS